MNKVSKASRESYDEKIWAEVENKFQISIRNDIKDFFVANNGGYPVKDVITFDNGEYEVRAFLSLDRSDSNYCIEKPLNYFLSNTKSRIIPIAIDSGDNYYCVNNETGKVYYWRASSDSYFLTSNSIEEFVLLFK